MLTIFRTNQPLANVLLLLYLGVLRASTFIHPSTVVPPSHGIFTEWLYSELSPISMVGMIAAFSLVFFQAVALNITVARYRLATEVSLLPGVFYCLLASLMPEFLPLTSVLLANTFVILALYYLFDTYKNNYVAGRIFDAGLWLGVASLFHFSYVLLIFWGIIGLGILRGIRLREFLMFILGYIAPVFLFAVYAFWTNNLAAIGKHFFSNIGLLSFIPYTNPTVYIKIGLIGLMLLLTVFASGQFFSRRNMTIQKYLSILYWLMLVGGSTTLIQSSVDLVQLLVVAAPLGILLSMTFQRIGFATAEALHMLLLMVALILQFEYLLVS